MSTLKGKTLFISGASRGIGKAIALRAAADGANIVIAAKTAEPHPTLPGTIYDAARDVESAGGKALPVIVDVRSEEQVEAAVQQAVQRYGGIDILVNNASAISLTSTEKTPPKRYDLMMDVNVRGSYVCSHACIAWLRKASNPHILMLAPPIPLAPKWFARHTPYTISKYSMSLLAMGLAEELRADGIAANTLWPRTIIDTAALKAAGFGSTAATRSAQIMADAAHRILISSSREVTGQFFVDEDLLRAHGEKDFLRYATSKDVEPMTDIFVD